MCVCVCSTIFTRGGGADAGHTWGVGVRVHTRMRSSGNGQERATRGCSHKDIGVFIIRYTWEERSRAGR